MTSILPTAVSTSDEAPFRFIDRYLGIDKKIHPTSSEYILRGHSSQQRRKVRFIRAVDIPYTMSILEKAEGTERRGSFAPELDGAEEFMDRLKEIGSGVMEFLGDKINKMVETVGTTFTNIFNDISETFGFAGALLLLYIRYFTAAECGILRCSRPGR